MKHFRDIVDIEGTVLNVALDVVHVKMTTTLEHLQLYRSFRALRDIIPFGGPKPNERRDMTKFYQCSGQSREERRHKQVEEKLQSK